MKSRPESLTIPRCFHTFCASALALNFSNPTVQPRSWHNCKSLNTHICSAPPKKDTDVGFFFFFLNYEDDLPQVQFWNNLKFLSLGNKALETNNYDNLHLPCFPKCKLQINSENHLRERIKTPQISYNLLVPRSGRKGQILSHVPHSLPLPSVQELDLIILTDKEPQAQPATNRFTQANSINFFRNHHLQFCLTFSNRKKKPHKILLLQGLVISQMTFLMGFYSTSFYVAQGQPNYLEYITNSVLHLQ